MVPHLAEIIVQVPGAVSNGISRLNNGAFVSTFVSYFRCGSGFLHLIGSVLNIILQKVYANTSSTSLNTKVKVLKILLQYFIYSLKSPFTEVSD